jgi:hypothetical protein
MDFWQNHDWFFLIFIAIFPRLTLLFAVATPFGWLAWLGWVFCPHLLVAILATTKYWDTNPVLCVISWIVALGGTGGEAKVTHSTTSHR